MRQAVDVQYFVAKYISIIILATVNLGQLALGAQPHANLLLHGWQSITFLVYIVARHLHPEVKN